MREQEHGIKRNRIKRDRMELDHELEYCSFKRGRARLRVLDS